MTERTWEVRDASEDPRTAEFLRGGPLDGRTVLGLHPGAREVRWFADAPEGVSVEVYRRVGASEVLSHVGTETPEDGLPVEPVRSDLTVAIIVRVPDPADRTERGLSVAIEAGAFLRRLRRCGFRGRVVSLTDAGTAPVIGRLLEEAEADLRVVPFPRATEVLFECIGLKTELPWHLRDVGPVLYLDVDAVPLRDVADLVFEAEATLQRGADLWTVLDKRVSVEDARTSGESRARWLPGEEEWAWWERSGADLRRYPHVNTSVMAFDPVRSGRLSNAWRALWERWRRGEQTLLARLFDEARIELADRRYDRFVLSAEDESRGTGPIRDVSVMQSHVSCRQASILNGDRDHTLRLLGLPVGGP